MKTSVREERLLIISDVHIGNPLVRAGRPFRDLLRFAIEHGYSVCINGDGVDIMQMSINRLTHEISECFGIIKQFPTADLRVYYIVGNHDIVLEHFLQDWAGLAVIPFLNVRSGEKRIRVEHGHMYDRVFLTYPRMYTAVTVVGRWAILLSPTGYHVLNSVMARVLGFPAWLRSRFSREETPVPEHEVIPGELPSFRAAAQEVSLRGFDAVVFGHTHHEGRAALPSGAVYFNTGFWMLRPHCVLIDHGEIWFGPVSDLPKMRATTDLSTGARLSKLAAAVTGR